MKSSIVEIQNLVINPNDLLTQTINNFYLRMLQAKTNGKIFQNPILGSFLPKGNFSKKLWLSTTGVVPQHLNVKDTE